MYNNVFISVCYVFMLKITILLFFIAVFIKLLFGKRHNNHFVRFWYERYELAWVFIGIPNF